MNCIVTKHPDSKLKAAIPTVLVDLGMIPLAIADDWKNSYNVMLDGKLIGLIEDKIIDKVAYKLRLLKIKGKEVSYEHDAFWFDFSSFSVHGNRYIFFFRFRQRWKLHWCRRKMVQLSIRGYSYLLMRPE